MRTKTPQVHVFVMQTGRVETVLILIRLYVTQDVKLKILEIAVLEGRTVTVPSAQTMPIVIQKENVSVTRTLVPTQTAVPSLGSVIQFAVAALDHSLQIV